jgi:hypothetical protein
MNSTIIKATVPFLGYGLALAGIKLIYSFFDINTILDIVVFLVAGFAIGRKVTENRWALIVGLSLPAFILCLLFVIRLGYQSIIDGVGNSYVISLVIIPIATAVGVLLASNFKQKQ